MPRCASTGHRALFARQNRIRGVRHAVLANRFCGDRNSSRGAHPFAGAALLFALSRTQSSRGSPAAPTPHHPRLVSVATCDCACFLSPSFDPAIHSLLPPIAYAFCRHIR
ncbi:hypothetical protein BU26DRAFT_223783 [Trematosphaeria pertusa]|uniref:Uncharacterized protein n=1 Tax=Trematosphaeria pertusa TaxID=390896 RepID=A0A6A6ITN9_9PLEO|nr:uncharacterized protein BU26DRAFT_223783 [Trematosphaeria pertusa]KAF2253477.1 hypothetical protein BU26DRAFT_223783 [Trematosphaeria pertusa]